MKSLLKLLKTNARLTNQELAVMLGSDEQTVAAEIAELEKSGVIRGYTAIIDDELTEEETVTAFVEVKVTPQAQSGFEDIAKTISSLKEVESCFLMSGAYDLGITVVGTDLRDISQFVAQRLSPIDGILSTATYFVLKKYKGSGILISDKEIDERGFVSP